jgi:hypothetical protein
MSDFISRPLTIKAGISANRKVGGERADVPPPRLYRLVTILQQKEPSVNAILKERIGERVGALKISWRRASLEAGLEAGFIQDVITGRSQQPSGDALASLATVLKCSTAYLAGQSDDLAGGAEPQGIAAATSNTAPRPDAVMALRIIDELLAAGHIEAARVTVKRALKSIALD